MDVYRHWIPGRKKSEVDELDESLHPEEKEGLIQNK
jgi:hypothetical protein